MTPEHQLPLLSWQARQARETAPEGIKRAVRASGVDPAVIAVCRRNLGRVVTELDFWAEVTAIHTCLPDTARRRRDALESEGHLSTERAGLGCVRIVSVEP